jgi:protocatechuate 3,4-dioxygenase beta subunit
MRLLFSLLTSFGLLGTVWAADPASSSFDIRVNLTDQRVVQLALTVPDGTQHRLQVDGDLGVELQVRWIGRRQVKAVLVNTAGGAVHPLSELYRDLKPDGAPVQLSFSVCGDRVITLPDAAPGVCAALPPMAKPDRTFPASCRGCLGPYEGMPVTITSHARIAPPSEPGEPLTITGRVLGPDGQPRMGVIVYAYHTSRDGIYPPPERTRSDVSNFHGRLRGWARSDAQGRYTFDTVRPASYPNSTLPQHVHMHVIEPGCGTYIVDELWFSDDPMFQRMSAAERAQDSSGAGGPAVGTPRRKGQGWQVTRDIHLGENIPGYEGCPAPK